MFKAITITSFVLLFVFSNSFALTKNVSKSTSTVKVQKVIKKKKLPDTLVTFVELGSVTRIPCKMMQPVMAEIEKEYGNKGVKIIFYDVKTNEGNPYAQKYGIQLIPTQVFLDKSGKEFFRHEGFFPKEDIVKLLKKQGVK
ncbi:MAG: thioredoxin family protein [Elusimicrobia bacterium]|nr:thioredoxin family protein [Elusimicrobiota bacterium]